MLQDGTGRASIALWWGKFLVLTLIGCVGWGGALGQEDDDKDDDDRRGVQDFSLSVTPSTGSVVQGQSRTYTVELSSIDSDGIDDEISLTVSGLGTGVTGTFAGSLSSADTSTRLTVRASPSASLTRRGYTVTGTADNGLTREASAVVTVTARQPTSFSITPAPPRRCGHRRVLHDRCGERGEHDTGPAIHEGWRCDADDHGLADPGRQWGGQRLSEPGHPSGPL